MICSRCLLHLRPRQPSSLIRTFSNTPLLSAGTGQAPSQAPRGPARGTHEGVPAALSGSGAQPFSTPSNDVATPVIPASSEASSSPEIPKSSVPAGAVLKGLGFEKNKNDPVAMEDSAYPSWLWGLLNTEKAGSSSGAGGEEADIYAKTRKQRRSAAKSARKAAMKNPGGNIPSIPMEEQTIDLPSGDGTIEGAIQALEARDELTHAMRRSRRKAIKEQNFLKGMS